LKKRIYALLFIGIFSFLLLIYMFPYNFMPKQEIANNVPVQKRALAKYTYISYVCADNNLENYGKMDVNEMEAGFNDSVTDVNVITLLDILNGETTAYYISHDDQPSVITSTMLLIEGLTPEENMGDPNTLVTYMNWCMTYYPAEHYILDLWDHGNGWAVCFDESSGDDAITMAELRDALDQINSSTGNKIDILCMDACLMGTLEVAYEIHDYAAILIASEDAVVATGFPYDDIIADLCANPDQNITEFASATVDLFHNHIIFFNPSTLSAVNLSLVETALIPSFVSFAQNLHLYLNYGIKNELYNARAASEEFYYPQFIDLYDFTQKTKIQATNATIQLLAQNLLDNISPAIINEKHFNNPGAHGLSLYFPELQNSYSSAYATSFSLSNDTMWDDFLVKYYTSANFGLGLRFFAINDSLGNNNETPDPGETVLLEVTLENVGGITAGFVSIRQM
jgi:hypothetical protein